MKKFISLFLVLIIIFSVSCQCTLSASAVVGVDDAVIIGVCLDLLALGITIHSVNSFCQSDTFADFCYDIGEHIDNGISTMQRNGKLFLATTKMAWNDFTSWVKRKFSALGGTKNITYDVTTQTTPSTITLNNGVTVPYHEFMENPFMIYHSPAQNTECAIYCTGREPGAYLTKNTTQIMCVGSGKVGRYDIEGGSWVKKYENNMTSGYTYKGQNGSIYNYNFVATIDCSKDSFWLYRTIPIVTGNSGTVNGNYSPSTSVPEVTVPQPETLVMTADPEYYPGAVEAPVEAIQDGELLLIEVPQSLVVGAGTNSPTLTTDLTAIGNTVADLVPADVNPRVLTNTQSTGATVDDIIADTPDVELPVDANNPSADIETANKFRLPQSFLEGFPFSIPYSVYVGIQSFVSDPITPVFDIPFSIPRLGIDENFQIDLTQFNSLARLCRALLSLVWVAGLAMACSKFIKR